MPHSPLHASAVLKRLRRLNRTVRLNSRPFWNRLRNACAVEDVCFIGNRVDDNVRTTIVYVRRQQRVWGKKMRERRRERGVGGNDDRCSDRERQHVSGTSTTGGLPPPVMRGGGKGTCALD